MSESPVRRIDTGTTTGGDVFSPPTKVEKTSPLDSLRDALAADFQNPPLTLAVKARPGIEVRFNTNIDADILQAWRKRARDRKAIDEFNAMRFATTVIANQAEVFIQSGQEVVDSEGAPINFRSESILEWTKALSVPEAVRIIYGMDGHVMSTSAAILEAAGYADDMEEGESDPT